MIDAMRDGASARGITTYPCIFPFINESKKQEKIPYVTENRFYHWR